MASGVCASDSPTPHAREQEAEVAYSPVTHFLHFSPHILTTEASQNSVTSWRPSVAVWPTLFPSTGELVCAESSLWRGHILYHREEICIHCRVLCLQTA